MRPYRVIDIDILILNFALLQIWYYAGPRGSWGFVLLGFAIFKFNQPEA